MLSALLRGTLLATAITSTLLAVAGLAEAHERREVGGYTIEVGWQNEPAVAGVLNAVFVEVRERSTDALDSPLAARIGPSQWRGGAAGLRRSAAPTHSSASRTIPSATSR